MVCVIEHLNNMIFLDIDTVIPFSRKYPHRTIREIIRADSGYLKDLFVKDDRVVFSDSCFKEICRLTRGHKDNWETPVKPSLSIFSRLKTYKESYLFDLMMRRSKPYKRQDLKCVNNIFIKFLDNDL